MRKTNNTLIALLLCLSSLLAGCNNDQTSPQSSLANVTTTSAVTTDDLTSQIHDDFEFSQQVLSGNFGEINWKIDEYGLLVVSGNGAISDFVNSEDVPWHEICDDILYVKVESGITDIGAGAFCNCKNVRRIMICGEISSIGNYAFFGCESLKTLSIGGNVASIGISAFENCYTLEEIDAELNPTLIAKCAFKNCISLCQAPKLYNINRIEDYTFSGCISMQFDEIPQNVECIGRGAFENCKALLDLTLPPCIDEICESAFAGSGLCELTIPSNVTTIGIAAFANCEKLQTLSLSDGLIDIEMAAFSGCTELQTVLIPQSVEYIDSNVFAHCTSLYAINVDENNANYQSVDGVLYTESMRTLKQYPLGCDKSEFVLPARVTAIEPGALYGKSALNSVDVEQGNWSYTSLDGVLYAGSYEEVVYYPYGKTDKSYLVPATVTSVDIYAFYGNEYLENAILTPQVKHIGGGAFENCKNLSSVDIREDIDYIGKNAFIGTGLNCEFSFCDGVEYFESSFPNGCTVSIMQSSEIHE